MLDYVFLLRDHLPIKDTDDRNIDLLLHLQNNMLSYILKNILKYYMNVLIFVNYSDSMQLKQTKGGIC